MLQNSSHSVCIAPSKCMVPAVILCILYKVTFTLIAPSSCNCTALYRDSWRWLPFPTAVLSLSTPPPIWRKKLQCLNYSVIKKAFVLLVPNFSQEEIPFSGTTYMKAIDCLWISQFQLNSEWNAQSAFWACDIKKFCNIIMSHSRWLEFTNAYMIENQYPWKWCGR